jgi:glycosyltransferase involved in cell wall biosynthesis
MRICIAYDCLFPYTVGGGERWYRNLAERLAADGHEVTYLTLRQWDRHERPDAGAGVRVRIAGPRMALYTDGGRRRIMPPLVYGAGVLWHLLRHGRRYDVVHTSSFPYFSLLAAALVRPLTGYELIVDWFEVWSRSYWRDYLGGARGTPSVVIASEDNAATELVAEGVNGAVAERADAESLADAIVRVHEGGPALRLSTTDWFAANAESLSLEHSLRIVLESYGDDAPTASGKPAAA